MLGAFFKNIVIVGGRVFMRTPQRGDDWPSDMAMLPIVPPTLSLTGAGLAPARQYMRTQPYAMNTVSRPVYAPQGAATPVGAVVRPVLKR